MASGALLGRSHTSPSARRPTLTARLSVNCLVDGCQFEVRAQIQRRATVHSVARQGVYGFDTLFYCTVPASLALSYS